ncbi:MAG: helix-turn-helix transcriptional regulator [Bacteroidales bacterium]|nr:helix-turn-helix transcriptional regulator [Bacteroidales bacterium]
MAIDFSSKTQLTVCETPSGNGFRVEHMPDMLTYSDIDDCSDHIHSFYEILWFQEGEGMHTIDFVEYEVHPGTIFFISPGQIHHFDKKEGYKGMAIKMCTDFMRDEEGSNEQFLKYNVFHTFDAAPYFRIDKATSDMLAVIAQEMDEEAANYSGEFGNIEILKSLLRIFLIKTLRYGTAGTPMDVNHLKPSHQLYIRFRQMVEKQYKQMHTVQDYADKLNVAVRTLNKCVNDCANRSPLALINERSLLEAKRMVRYTNMLIKEIAIDLGYEDPSYFVKFFKRQTGYLPSDFRELEAVSHCKVR